MTRRLLIFILILGLSILLRTYHLSDRPLGFTWDEASIGFNAYSLLHTGHDEYGQLAPPVFKSFGDYKPGLYIYQTIPFVTVLGLSEFSTRLASVVSGVILVLLVYLLAFTTKRTYFPRSFGSYFPEISALLIAVNPWAIQFSRGAWEANSALALTLLAVLLYTRNKFSLSLLFFGLTLWTYQGAKLMTPFLIFILFIVNKSRTRWQQLVLPGFIFALIIIPILVNLPSQSGRLKVYSVFNYQRQGGTINAILAQDHTQTKNLSFYLFHTEFLDQLRGIIQRYLNHFSPRFLFFDGNWSTYRETIPYSGYLLLPELVLILFGLYVVIKHPSPISKLILFWLVVAPIPSALSRDIVSGVRSLPLLVPLTFLSSLGLTFIFRRLVTNIILITLLGFFVVRFIDLYYIHAPFVTASDWLSPYKMAWQIIPQVEGQYDQVIFTQKLGQPYIFALFYLHANPRLIQNQTKLVESKNGDVGQITQLGKYQFRNLYWPNDRYLKRTLFVGDANELPEGDLQTVPGLIRIAEISYPNGSLGLRLVGTK